MSIIDTFDFNGEEIIKAKNNVRMIENFPTTLLVVFSAKVCNLFLSKYDAIKIGALFAGGQEFPIYQFEYRGIKLGFFNTVLGGAGSAALLEELIALGAEKLIYFGSCGALHRETVEGRLLVPTAAYRDEGVSYHYAEVSDYLEIETASALMQILDDMHISYNATKTWTTDAFYRETRSNLEKRKAEGCGVVEMECASIMAVGQFRKKKVYQFLYAADCLADSDWDKRILGNMPTDLRERILLVAIEVATRL
ncbi:MAG: nucleoside phosphorylase [Clostridia bacterium]|nr:nucleoside phosphorylase [Clostridia bacterium]